MSNKDQKSSRSRWIPSQKMIREHKSLRFLARYLDQPQYWEWSRNSVSKACMIGIFMAFMPMPFQMIPGALFGILFRANLFLSIGLVWISNPITMPPMLYGCYLLGRWMLQSDAPDLTKFTLNAVLQDFHLIWMPLLSGCVVAGLIAGFIGMVLSWSLWSLFSHKLPQNRK